MYHKKILHVNLNEKTADFKMSGDLYQTVGGIVTAYHLINEYVDERPIVLTTGPLNGYFPYVSKSCLLYQSSQGVEEKFGGGTIGSKMNFAGLDAIVITGYESSELTKIDVFANSVNLSSMPEGADNISETADLSISRDKIISKGYFSFGEVDLSTHLSENAAININIDQTISRDLVNAYDYEKLYSKILDMYKDLTVEPGNNPSCVGCPIGCDLSNKGEDDLNISVLPRCLVACGYSASIFKQIPIAFACLQSVGYYYNHSDLEALPQILAEQKERLKL